MDLRKKKGAGFLLFLEILILEQQQKNKKKINKEQR